MSSDGALSAVTYTSISSEARSWSILTEDPYEEATRQALKQASPAYVLDTMELEDHVQCTFQSQITKSTLLHQMMIFLSRIGLYLLMLHLQPYHRATLLTLIQRKTRRIMPTILPTEEKMMMMSSDDGDEDHVDVEEEYEEEEEHLAPADSTAVASPAVDLVPFVEETEPFETDESAATPPLPPVYHTTSRMSVRTQTPITFPSEEEVARLLALPTLPPSPLTSLSSPPTSPTYA
ncbi:hypothetical protein Tco_0911271 [Tanacetum coccineum]|uniref:Uncharacterized protein n=1 Tax=Tanacetum coccineum TaxID=301880 RepID=A0ABQ5CVB1_9ASTR